MRLMTLLCGPANSGKIAIIHDRFRHDCADAGAWLIVPTRSDVVREGYELARNGPLVGGTIGTFHNLVQELSDGNSLANELIDVVIVRRLLESRRDQYRATRFPQFVQTATRVISELRQAHCAGVDQLEKALDTFPNPVARVWRQLLEEYEDILHASSRLDSASLQRDAIRAVDNSAFVVPTYVYGFDDLDEMQLQLLEAIAQRVPVTISLPFVTGRPVFERRSQMVERFEENGAEVIESGTAEFESTLLTLLEDRIFDVGADPIIDLPEGEEPPSDAECDINFVECSGDIQEAEEVVRAVARHIQRGTSLSEIVCLAVDPTQLRSLLEVAFRDAGIPAFFATGRKLHNTPAGRAVLDAVRAAGTLDVQALRSYLRSRVSGIEQSEVEQLQSEQLETKLTTPEYREFASALRAGVPAYELVSVFGKFVGSMVPATDGDSRLLGAIVDVVERTFEPLADTPVRFDEFLDVVSAIPIPPPESQPDDSVLVAPISRVRTNRFDAVVFFGLDARSATHVGDDDAAAPEIAQERTYVAVTRARKSMTCIRQTTDSNGSIAAAHSAWLELQRLLKGAPLRRRGIGDVVHATEHVVLGSEVARSVASARASGGDVGGVPSDVDSALAAFLLRAMQPRDAVAGSDFTAAIADQESFSVSEVMNYLKCSAMWFIDGHLLGRRNDDSPARRVGNLAHEVLELFMTSLVSTSDDVDRIDLLDKSIDVAVRNKSQDLRRRESSELPYRGSEIVAVRLLLERFVVDEKWHGDRVLTEVEFGRREDALPAVQAGSHLLHGRVDRIDVDAGNVAVLHDYKTGGGMNTTGVNLVREGEIQLLLYWSALRASGSFIPRAAIYRSVKKLESRGLLDEDESFNVAEKLYKNDKLKIGEIEEHVAAAVERAGLAVDAMLLGVVEPLADRTECPSYCSHQPICRIGVR